MKRPRRSSLHSFLRCHCIRAFHLIALMLSLFFKQNSSLAMTQSWITALSVIPSATSSTILAPHAFPLSESELRDLAEALAPKVDLFREVWEKDPEAEFFAGTTRDYLYWILGHFKGLENLDSSTSGTKQSDAMREKIEEIKAKLLATPFIKFNEIVGPESDADIMTKNQEALSDLRAEDFAIRKLDFISFDRAVPGQSMYQDEINQGYIPSEKIRLSKKGISTDQNFGNGVADLVSGNLSIQFPDRNKFWKTHYAKEGANHPLLLALRYVRILSQDYLQRHGSEIPDAQKLEAPMTKEIKIKIQNLIQEAISDTDGSFKKLLHNGQGKKWLNASIQKSFRSFTNANAAFELMKELGILSLIEIYSDQIESVHQYLLKAKRDPQTIAENFRQFEVKPTDLYQDLSDYLPDLELYHGTASELAFRNIIYQGVVPSGDGSAGRGLYGVSKQDLDFAKNWSKGKSKQDDLVIALKLKATTTIVDITKGKGKVLFEKWMAQKGKDSESPEDDFAEAFGIDLLRYPYNNTEAFVLKNADQILSRRGVFKNPRPLSALISEAVIAREKNDLYFLKDFLETPLTKDERNKIITILGAPFFKKALWNIRPLKKYLNLQIVSLLEILIYSPFTSIHSLLWNEVRALLKDKRADVRQNMTESLLNCPAWPPPFWNEVPALLRDRSEHVRQNMAKALEKQSIWPPLVWNEVPALLKDSKEKVRKSMTEALQKQSTWPPLVWNEVPALLKDKGGEDVQWQMIKALHSSSPWPPPVWNEVHALLMDNSDSVRSMMTAALASKPNWPTFVWDIVPVLLKDRYENVLQQMTWALRNQTIWPSSFWNEVPSLLKDTNLKVRVNMTIVLQDQSAWPPSFWNEVPVLLRDPNEYVRQVMPWALKNQSTWPPSFWNEAQALMKDPNENVRSFMTWALQTQSVWPQDIITLVAQSKDPLFQDLKEMKPSVLDLTSCENSLSEIPETTAELNSIEPENNTIGEASP